MTELFPDANLGPLSEFVAERLGLYFPPDRWGDLGRAMETVRQEFGFADVSQCARWMMSVPLTPKQVDVLVNVLTVGETYFFREKELFAVLEGQILLPLVGARRARDQRLRIWSVACCTGEEAYSLAILVHRLLPDLSQWNVTILASDINRQFLAKARTGEYREWSFRDAPEWLKENYFTARDAGCYVIKPEIRRMVTFSPLNLVEDCYPSPVNGIHSMDLILCRNVLMYFDPGQATKAIRKLAASLVPGGWLTVSPCEVAVVTAPNLVAKPCEGITFFRRPQSDRQPAADETVAVSEDGKGARPEGVPHGDICIQQAHECANRGDLSQALAWCDRAIVTRPFDVATHYLRACTLYEQGNLSEATRSFQRALAIDPDFVIAHFSLGNAARRQRKHHESRRHYAKALLLLERYTPDEILPEADGLTAGRLREMISFLMEEVSHGQ